MKLSVPFPQWFNHSFLKVISNACSPHYLVPFPYALLAFY